MLLRRAARTFAAALAIGGALLTVPPAASAAAGAAPTLQLLRQSPSVTPAAPGSPAPFAISVKVAGPLPAGAELGLSFYSKLSTRGSFEQTLTNSPTGLMQTVAPQPVSSLRTVAGGGYQLSATIVAGSPQPAGSDTVDVRGTSGERCAVGTGVCSGVYPVVVQLFGADGTAIAHLTTYLSYAEQRSTDPLLFSWVATVSAPLDLVVGVPLDRAVARPDEGQVRNLTELIAALVQSPNVQATVAPSPATVEALENSGAQAARLALAGLRTLAASPTHHLLAEPYVPVNLGSLSQAGVTTEITGQTKRAQTVLAPVLNGLPATDQPDDDIWVTDGPVGPAVAQGLRLAQAKAVVLPDTDLATQSEQHATWSQPFRLSTGHGTDLTAAVSDTQLSSYFGAGHRDPVLAANQLLADLAMIQSELPHPHATRGVIAVPPYGWNPDPRFVAALLAGLADSPVVSTVTLPQFFTLVPVGGNEASTTRHLTTGETGERISGALAASIVGARRQIDGFQSAVAPAHPAVENQLEDLLLASESSQLSPSAQRNGIASFERQLAGVLGAIQVLRNTVTLTARTASIPITIVSSAGYRLNATLSLSSAKLQFPQGLTRKVHIDHPTNSTTVEVRARTTGDLPLAFKLTSPDGSLLIAKGSLTVRSTATSIVGIVLTLIAAMVLLGWWARTWRKGRAQRHGRVTRVTP
ncbi:MAG: hypothetical protein ACRDYB_10470 [Acidimicrobiales bacterium]